MEGGNYWGIKSWESIHIQRFVRPRKSQNGPIPRAQHGKVDLQAGYHDCFQFLPMEIRFHIAQYPYTVEIFNLRLSSKAMVPLFESQQFWRTRFLLHGRRGYFNFLAEDGFQDWRLLYRYAHSNCV